MSESKTPLRLRGKLILDAVLHCETGLHIGAGKGSLEIGGADNPVVKDAFGRPIVPGSSLRGRLRSLLEHAHGLTVDRKFASIRAIAPMMHCAYCSDAAPTASNASAATPSKVARQPRPA